MLPSNFNRISRRQILALGTVALWIGVAATANGQTLAPVDMPTLPALFHSTLVGHEPSNRVVHLNLSLQEAHPGALQAYVDDVSNPGSPNYRKFLSPDEIGQRFGASPVAVHRVVDYLRSNGMTVTLVGGDNMHVMADGMVYQAEAAFHTTINHYRSFDPKETGNADYIAYSLTPQLPSDIAPAVAHIGGLQTWNKPKARTTLTPNQASTLYNTVPLLNAGKQGQGRTVAISSWDGYRLSNVPLYVKQYALPTPSGGAGSNITVVPIDGGSGSGTPGGEGDLDIQMVIGQAPLSNVLVYDGNSSVAGDYLNVLTKEENDDKADVITESYGWNLDSATTNAAHNLRLEMSAEGITYLVASGDDGTATLSGPFVYPDFDPETLEVGGSAAQTNAAGVRQSEVGWTGSAGGWSTLPFSFNVLPSWQKATGVPTNINFRLVPDIAAHSAGDQNDDFGAVYIFFNGQIITISGTSDASPMMAGQLAVAEQQLIANGYLKPDKNGHYRFGRINDLLYSQNMRPDVWYDITAGSNGSLPNGQTSQAGPGWDFVTGLGAINWDAFVKALQAAPPVSEAPNLAEIYVDPIAGAEGTSATGGIAQLLTVDNSYYSVQSVSMSAGEIAASEFKWTLPSSSFPPVDLKLTLVTNAPATASQFVYLFNFTSGTWDLVKQGQFTGSDSTVSVDVNMAKYVGPGNVVEAVDRGVQPARFGTSPYRLNVDQAVITVTY